MQHAKFIDPPVGLLETLQRDHVGNVHIRILHCMQMSGETCFVHIHDGASCFVTAAHCENGVWGPENRVSGSDMDELLDEFSAICHLQEELDRATN